MAACSPSPSTSIPVALCWCSILSVDRAYDVASGVLLQTLITPGSGGLTSSTQVMWAPSSAHAADSHLRYSGQHKAKYPKKTDALVQCSLGAKNRTNTKCSHFK